MRLDRLITLNLLYPIKENTKTKNRLKIPILMYHSISDEPEKGHPYFWINTSLQLFDEHMKYLYDNKYKVISLSEAVRILESGGPCSHRFAISDSGPNTLTPDLRSLHPTPSIQHPDKLVVLTFDDGYRNFFTKALPILQKYEFCANLYLPTSNIGTKFLKGEAYLDWDEVRELRNKSIEIGSHTVNHLQLKMLKKKEIEYEIRRSKEIIEKNLGETILSFSYPFAFPEADKELKRYLRKILEASGYKNGVTTIIGLSGKEDTPYFLKRLPINSQDDLLLLKAKLEGCYDWMHLLQYTKKMAGAKIKKLLDNMSIF